MGQQNLFANIYTLCKKIVAIWMETIIKRIFDRFFYYTYTFYKWLDLSLVKTCRCLHILVLYILALFWMSLKTYTLITLQDRNYSIKVSLNNFDFQNSGLYLWKQCLIINNCSVQDFKQITLIYKELILFVIIRDVNLFSDIKLKLSKDSIIFKITKK